ncbi:MAG: hypothetical protein DKM22_01435 [Candidatus Melainabacteria bacterium]|nr:MAG: hypothetical protein DKM22_01435 [Candidatus Melainabacteria bacterium]
MKIKIRENNTKILDFSDEDRNNFRNFDFKTNFRISSLEQLKTIESCFLPDIIEAGEIISTRDIATTKFVDVIHSIQNFCKKNKIQFHLSTPKILIERDFERVYDEIKSLNKGTDCIIINNSKFLKRFVSENIDIPIELGYGLEINKNNLEEYTNLKNVKCFDFTKNLSLPNEKFSMKKYTIAGVLKMDKIINCPLKNPQKSGFLCDAKCKDNFFEITQNENNFPIICDGFCNCHMYEDIFSNFEKINYLKAIGINIFTFDFTPLQSYYIPYFIRLFMENFSKNFKNKK